MSSIQDALDTFRSSSDEGEIARATEEIYAYFRAKAEKSCPGRAEDRDEMANDRTFHTWEFVRSDVYRRPENEAQAKALLLSILENRVRDFRKHQGTLKEKVNTLGPEDFAAGIAAQQMTPSRESLCAAFMKAGGVAGEVFKPERFAAFVDYEQGARGISTVAKDLDLTKPEVFGLFKRLRRWLRTACTPLLKDRFHRYTNRSDKDSPRS